MHASFLIESMVWMPFMCLPLPVSFFGLVVHFCCLFLTFCNVGESGSLFFAFRFLPGLGLAWARALSSSIRPCFSLLLVYG